MDDLVLLDNKYFFFKLELNNVLQDAELAICEECLFKNYEIMQLIYEK